MKELRIAIVGMGGIGNTHFESWKKVSGTRVVSLCVHQKRSDSEIPCYTDLQKMLECE